MSNPSPNLENLAKGRGKKPKLGHKSYSVKLAPANKEKLDKLAKSFGCTYAEQGSISGLLTEIAEGNLMITETPPNLKSILSLLPDDPIEVLTRQVVTEVEQSDAKTSHLSKLGKSLSQSPS